MLELLQRQERLLETVETLGDFLQIVPSGRYEIFLKNKGKTFLPK